MVTEAIERRGGSLTDWVSGVPERSEAKMPTLPEVLSWDLRPKGPQGNLDGAGGRQRARMEHLISVGTLAEGVVEGTFERNNHNPRQKTTVRETVVACVPISVSEMIPDAAYPLEGFVTPLWPTRNPEWLMNGDLSKLPPEEE